MSRTTDKPNEGRGTRRSSSPRRAEPLRRAEIVAAAITATERGHLHDLTMRGLAEGLRVTPMALYAHVADKDEILDEVLDHLLTELAVPSADLDWRGWMTEFASQINGLLCDYPDLLARYLRRPVGVRAAVVRMESALDVLSRAGFAGAECVDIYASVLACTLGFTALEVARGSASAPPAPEPGDSRVAVRPDAPGFWPAFFSMLPSAEFPHLSSLQPDLQTFSSPASFLRVIGDLLAGHHPPARRRAGGRSPAHDTVEAPATRAVRRR